MSRVNEKWIEVDLICNDEFDLGKGQMLWQQTVFSTMAPYRENIGENLDTKYIADQVCLTKLQTAAATTKPNQKRALSLCNKFLTVGGVLVVVKHLTQ